MINYIIKPILMTIRTEQELPVSWTAGRKVVISKPFSRRKKIRKNIQVVGRCSQLSQTVVSGYVGGCKNWHSLSEQESHDSQGDV